jgi:hypothetical protein
MEYPSPEILASFEVEEIVEEAAACTVYEVILS